MRFMEDRSRARYTSMVLHDLVLPPPVVTLGEVLAAQMHQLSGGRLWMEGHWRLTCDAETVSDTP